MSHTPGIHAQAPLLRGVTRLIPERLRLPLLGVMAGLFVGRVIAETSARAWPLRELGVLSLLCLSIGVLLALMLGRVARRAWPLALCLVYVVWPSANPALAQAVGVLVGILLWMLNVESTARARWIEGLIFLVGLALYVSTLAPTLLPADAGEFQLVAATLGIAHPPGYALYTMLGKIFTLLPLGDVAYRVNLFAAICAALTLAVLARIVQRETGSMAAALVAVAMLGFSATFWAQGTTANIRSLAALLTVLCLSSLLQWASRRSPKDLVFSAVWFSLAVGHHASTVFLAPPLLAFVLLTDPHLLLEPKRWVGPLVAAVLSTLVILYLPLRSRMGPAFDPTPIRSWADLAQHVLATGFRGDMLHYRTWDVLEGRLGVWRQIMRLQFGYAVPWIVLVSLVPLLRRWRLAMLLIGIWAMNTLAAITYRAPQTVEYLMPSYVALAAILGCGLGLAPRIWRLPQSAYAGLVTVVLLAVSLYALPNGGSFAELHRDRSARDYAQSILQDAPQNAVILSSWHRATPFWYLQIVEAVRPDVTIRYVFPEGAMPNDQVWLRRIGEEMNHGPVIVTNRFQSYADTNYRWIPFHEAWLVRAEPLLALPHEIERVERVFGESIELIGYRLDQALVEPGESLDLRVYWRPLDPLARDYSTFAQLVGPSGVIGQSDILHRSRKYLPGEIRVDAYRIPILLHAAPGDYALITGFYHTDGGGWTRLTSGEDDHASIGRVTVLPQRGLIATLHPMHLAFSGGWRLRGLDVDRSVAEQVRLYLHWERMGLELPRIDLEPESNSPLLAQLLSANTVLAEAQIPWVPVGHTLTTALDLRADTQWQHLTVRLVADNGQTLSQLGPWHRPRETAQALALPGGPDRYVPLGGEIVYLGMQGSPPQLVRGERPDLYPLLLASRPIVNDYSISLGILQQDSGWERKSDGTPGLGAIPTFKWVTGWLVEDPRRIALDGEAPTGEASLSLSAYDAFTLDPLRVLDERLVAMGQGTTLDVGSAMIVAK